MTLSPDPFYPQHPVVQLSTRVRNGFWHSGSHCIPYHTTAYHNNAYHCMPYHTLPYHCIPYYNIACHTIPYHTNGTPGATPQFSSHCWQKPCFQPCHNFLPTTLQLEPTNKHEPTNRNQLTTLSQLFTNNPTPGVSWSYCLN